MGEGEGDKEGRERTANRQPFNDDEKPSDSNDHDRATDHKEKDDISTPTTDQGTKKHTSRFRKNKHQEAKGSSGDHNLDNQDEQTERKKDEPENEEEDNQEKQAAEEKKPPLKVRNDNCCMPVAGCLASCFGGMGFGYRRSGEYDGKDLSVTSTGRRVDTQMWDMIQRSIAFQNVQTSAFCINIGRLSDLQGVLCSAVKPFVKVHIVDVDTGHYVLPVATGKISVSRTAPLLTRQASLQGTSSDIPKWDEELCFPNLSFKDVVSPQNLILFEVLDDPPSLSFRKAQNINSSKDMSTRSRTYSTLAWAFLLPVGQQVNVGYPKTKRKQEPTELYSAMQPAAYDMSLRLQLYQYQADTVVTRLQRIANRWPAAERLQQKQKKTESFHRYPDNIPEVYLQYQRKSHELVSVFRSHFNVFHVCVKHRID